MSMGDYPYFPWPYPIRYGQQDSYETDVLILGGGIAGVWAAIAARRTGARVTIMEKADTRRSGAGGTGVDHWGYAADNPCSTITPEEMTSALVENHFGYRSGISTFIHASSAYETLLEMEAMGGKVRDTDDEFKGAPFRDDATKLLFAYDYDSRYCIRVWGANYKPLLRRECKRLGVNLLDRTSATSLLTEDGAHGSRAVGATGIDCHTGAFVVVRAKALILATNRPQRIFTFSSEHRGVTAHRGGSNVGNGYAMGWRIGAEFTLMEKTIRSPFASPYSYPVYGTGNALNTWYPATIVDANNKEVPWVDCNGKVLDTVDERCRPAEGQKFILMGGGNASQPHPGLKKYAGPKLIPDLETRMMQGEFKPPFYADLTSMPWYERKAIWGVMVGQEGKTRVPILQTYEKSGFDPARDMLQTYDFLRGQGMREFVAPQERTFGEIGVAGGLLVDWDLMSNIPGLFGAGDLLFGSQDHVNAATTGRYAGARAAIYARAVGPVAIDEGQIEREKKRVYAPLSEPPDSIDWKELNIGIARVMQNYCAELKNEELLHLAETWLADIEQNEVRRASAANPHQLMRTLDVTDILTCAQMIVHASQARKASSDVLSFCRIDYPANDPPEWHKYIAISQDRNQHVRVSDRPLGFWGDYESNYRPRHAENIEAMHGVARTSRA
jgi:succinate dehydrogenase/fumarate reductase flavoprotein subunit